MPRCYHCGHVLDHIDAPCPICLPNFHERMQTMPSKTYTPWTVDVEDDAQGFKTIRLADGTCYGNTEDQPIATVYDHEHARLIAAAPEIAEALELAEATIMRLNRHDSANETLDVIRAILAKIRGE